MTDQSTIRSGETQPSQADANDDSLDESQNNGNTSIIGKVKSRVSSILPNSISKWFSPSAQKSESLNGTLNENRGFARRRRRLELDEDDDDEDNNIVNDDDDDDDEDDEELGEEEENTDEDDEEDEETSPAAAVTASDSMPSVTVRRNQNILSNTRQPPSKRSRLNIENTNTMDGTFMSRSPLVASTPAIGGDQIRPTRSNRYAHLNLYGNQRERESAYNFQFQPMQERSFDFQRNLGTGGNDSPISAPLKSGDTGTNAQELPNAFTNNNYGISSRRSLNIPATPGLSQLKRQSLAIVQGESPSTSAALREQHPLRTSTTIFEVDNRNAQAPEDHAADSCKIVSEDHATVNICNGRQAGNGRFSKRQKLINGLPGGDDTIVDADTQEDSVSVSEGSDVDRTERASVPTRKTGLFNISASNSRNGSRTSSFGNGLNFYTHLEGRKSLFSGAHAANENVKLNSSTLSLTSLNRRQFNASIYGSTSALSDSRLLNTFSPFYKGKTTYGGAAAYNKSSSFYSGASAGAGANTVRITPTLIRPTSSLSTLSSSNNSLNTVGVGEAIANQSAISNTAKKILDLITEFSTPLGEAKKMANSLKVSNTSSAQLNLPQTRARLSDADVQNARAIRLSQVRTPYKRPAVILQPIQSPLQSTNGQSSILPPVRELQVPSMSQLLQMKKLQNTTERSRRIATQNSHSTMQPGASAEYTLPIMPEEETDSGKSTTQQKHTNKIKHKSSTALRATKDSIAADEPPPPPPNLPNIAFPLMSSVPKFDIPLPKAAPSAANTSCSLAASNATASRDNDAIKSHKPPIISAFTSPNSGNINTKRATGKSATELQNSSSAVSPLKESNNNRVNFKFSSPLEVHHVNGSQSMSSPFNGTFKFSAPAMVVMSNDIAQSPKTAPATQRMPAPMLKSGSVLEALAKPFVLPAKSSPFDNTTTNNITNNTNTNTNASTKMNKNVNFFQSPMADNSPPLDIAKSSSSSSFSSTVQPLNTFGNQFKKTGNEWECDTCLIRNKTEVSKCVACETPRKGTIAASTATVQLAAIPNTFGDAFKPKANTWECPTCMINNKSEVLACVACETKKPGAASGMDASVAAASATSTAETATTATPAFKFGFAPATGQAVSIDCDGSFKSLAAEQKASKWECEACMTRNDMSRPKCVCCDQAKPGTHASSEGAPKFSFGTASASQFSFGFGTTANAPKEEELRKIQTSTDANANKTSSELPSLTQKTETKGFLFDTNNTVNISSGGFSFGLKPPNGNSKSLDEPDIKKVAPASNFQFGSSSGIGVSASTSVPTLTTTSVTAAPVSGGFTFGTTSATPITSITNKSNTSPSVKFSFASTTSSSTKEDSAKSAPVSEAAPTQATAAAPVLVTAAVSVAPGSAPVFSFKSPSAMASHNVNLGATATTTATSTTVPSNMFSFGTSTTSSGSIGTSSLKPTFTFSAASSVPAATTLQTNTTTPSSVSSSSPSEKFSFASTTSTSSQNSTKLTLGTQVEAATTPSIFPVATAPSATVPTFSFKAPTTMTSQSANGATPTSAATATTVSNNTFSFGTSATSTGGTASVTSSSSSGFKPVFGSLFSGTTTTIAPTLTSSTSETTSTTSAPTTSNNIFGSFGGAPASGAFKPSTLGASSTSTPTFGTFGGAATSSSSTSASTNIFGSFGAAQSSDSKPIAAATTIFGNVAKATDTATTSASSSSTSFAFGSGTTTTAPKSNSGSETVTSSTNNNAWPNEGFMFGSSSAGNAASAISSTTSDVSKSVFGTFGSGQQSTNNNNASTSATSSTSTPGLFGNPAPSMGFGSNSTTFGTSSTSALNLNATTNSLGTASSVFGSAQSGTATTPAAAPVFGTSTFGSSSSNNNSINSATPTFGSTSAIGAAPPSTFGGFATANSNDGASAAKKSEPIFQFAAPNAQQNTSGGFNFGSAASAAKPAYNFVPTSQPAFNFTGSADGQAQSTRPFQFGATPSPAAPVFNFSGGTQEATPNAPFQFSAGVTPASSNIFDPPPTAPGPQTAQQARRKIRAPIRRLTPR